MINKINIMIFQKKMIYFLDFKNLIIIKRMNQMKKI